MTEYPSPLLVPVPENEFRIHLFETDRGLEGRIVVGDGVPYSNGGVVGYVTFNLYGDPVASRKAAIEFCTKHGVSHVIVTKQGLKTDVKESVTSPKKEAFRVRKKKRLKLKAKRSLKVPKVRRG